MCSISLNLTGLDTDTIIQQMMAIERQPLVNLQAQQAILVKRKAAWDAIKSKMGSVSSKLTSLVSSTTFTQKTVTLSDASVASARASSASVAGVYDLTVSTLASSQIVASSLRSSADEAIGISGIVTLNGKAITLSATDSLSSIAAKVNATADIGARASVLQAEPGKYQLVLTSEESGVANAMSFGGDTAAWQSLGVLTDTLDINQIKAASNAVFSINGVQYTRTSNSVSDAVPGVTLTLTTAGSTALTIANDDQAVVEYVKQFVTEYNSLIDTIKSYNTWDADTRVAGTLFGDPLLQRLLSALRDVIFDPVEGSVPGFSSMSAVGLSTGALGTYSRDGKLAFDEAKLKEALETNRDAVMVLFGAQSPNVALASAGSTVTASSSYSPEYAAEGVIDGSSSSVLWGSGGGWNDGTQGEFPDTLEIDFGTSRTIDTVRLFTLDSVQFPASSYGVKDFSVEYLDSVSGAWTSLFSVTGNTQGYVNNTFSPVETSRIRVNVTGSNDGQFSRILEVEAYQSNDGAFASLNDVMQTYTSADGLLPSRTNEIDTLDRDLTRQIENMQRRLDMRMESLKKKFTALEVMLSQFNSQSAWMTQQVNSIYQQNG